MLFASTLTKQLCASAVLATLASTSFVGVLSAETTETKPAEAVAAETKAAEWTVEWLAGEDAAA